ncbi:3208_t:CDS:2, partial [Racocetra fulgida]
EGLLNTGAGGQIRELASVDSAEFKVFRNKQFPGVVGANIPLRNEPERLNRNSEQSNEYDNTSDVEESASLEKEVEEGK